MAEVDTLGFVNTELKLIEFVFNKAHVLKPMVILIKDEKRTGLIAEFHSEIHKEMMSQGIKDLVKVLEPDVVIYFAEAWTYRAKSLKDYVPASQHPNRIEIVSVRIEFKTGEKYDCEAKILRQDGQVHLDKFEILPGGMSMGRFVDFYPITRTN